VGRAVGDQAISRVEDGVCANNCKRKRVFWSGLEGGVWLLALDAGRFSLHLTAARRHGNQESAPLAEHYLPKILNFVCGQK
jgi:hypothetical protein